MESARAWRYRHWASGGASSLSPLLSDTPPIGLVRFQSPSPDQSPSQAGPGDRGERKVKVRSAGSAALAHPFPAVMNVPARTLVPNNYKLGSLRRTQDLSLWLLEQQVITHVRFARRDMDSDGSAGRPTSLISRGEEQAPSQPRYASPGLSGNIQQG